MFRFSLLLLPLVLISCQCNKSKVQENNATTSPTAEIKIDAPKTVEELTVAAQKGDVDAQFQLGARFAAGDLDLKKAFEWFLKAAENGDMRAQIEVAKRYNSGVGVESDENKAFEWFTKAAEKGNVDAQKALGLLYWNGASAPLRDRKKAEMWFEKAIAQGDKVSEGMLKEMKAESPKTDKE
jgi:TPR repeat protein